MITQSPSRPSVPPLEAVHAPSCGPKYRNQPAIWPAPLFDCPEWDPDELCSPHRSVIGEPVLLPDDIPFAQAKEMIADPEVDEFGSTEVFVDDLFTAFPALSEDHIKRCAEAIPLAVEIIGHPLAPEEPLHRDVLLATIKAMAEGTPSEILTILGWVIDTRRLLIILPEAKAKFWADEIRDIRSKHGQIIPHKYLESLVGRLQHVAAVLQEGGHFLNHLRAAEN